MRYLHVSTEVVAMPFAAPQVDQDAFTQHIARGDIRDVSVTPIGRVGRAKGATYRVPGGRLRTGKRAAHRREVAARA